jgi:UDP-glucose 4-epimerase
MATLSGARTLITGGAGLIGSHIADLLVGEDVGEVVILDNLSRGRLTNLSVALQSPRVSVVEGDIRDPRLLARHLAGIDTVFHMAAIRLTQCAEDPRLALEVMADGTFNVLEASVAAKVRRIVAASSASIYGMAERFPTDESHHTWGNRTLYGAAKVFNEGLLTAFRDTHGLDYVALRPFNVYGPRMDTHGAYTEVLIRWMERIDRGQPPLIFGDGTQSMDFVFVEDVARAFVLAAGSDAAGEVFNVASGTETTLKELAETLLSVMGSRLAIEYGPVRALTAVPRRLADTRLARKRLGFVAQVSLREGLERLVSWWQSRQEPQPPGAAPVGGVAP